MRHFPITVYVFLLSCVAFLSSCSPSSGRIKLCDYKDIPIPEEILTVSDEDLNSTVMLNMYVYNILVPKSNNPETVELDDVVTVSIIMDGVKDEYSVVVGTQMLGSQFDDCILGKKTGDTFDFIEDGHIGQATIISISVYADAINDEIAKKYYDCASADEAIETLKDEISMSKLFEYIYPEIIAHSMISGFYQDRKEYVGRAMNLIRRDALNEGYQVDDAHSIEMYLNAELGLSFLDFQEGLEAFYDEYLILCELMRQEDATVTEEEFASYYEYIESTAGDDSFGFMGREYAYYNLYYERCAEVLYKYYKR